VDIVMTGPVFCAQVMQTHKFLLNLFDEVY